MDNGGNLSIELADRPTGTTTLGRDGRIGRSRAGTESEHASAQIFLENQMHRLLKSISATASRQ